MTTESEEWGLRPTSLDDLGLGKSFKVSKLSFLLHLQTKRSGLYAPPQRLLRIFAFIQLNSGEIILAARERCR